MFEWWEDVPVWLRLTLSLGLLAISTVVFFAGYFWPWGWAIGGVLLVFSFIGSGSRY